MKRTFLSEKGYEELQENLKVLLAKKKATIKRVKEAADHGDISDNFEYDSAKEALALVMNRIKMTQLKLSTADIVKEENVDSDRVVLGVTVYLEETDSGENVKFSLVVEDEVELDNNNISVNSHYSS
ncbi:MAG: GreA/GreB family elongation factor [Elusimicrobia bacterium]|jgi:transcription elongation factor GreA|nr:GreA/GreB family elongation factor [Elusimicrobiota bacterium]